MPSSPGVFSEIEEALVSWSVKLASGHASERDYQDFHQWLASNPAHQQAWQKLQSLEASLVNIPETAKTLAINTLDAASRQRAVQHGRRKALKLLGMGLVFVTTGAYVLNDHGPWALQTEYAVPIGGRMRLDLADGTQLMLNTNTRIRVHYSLLKREIVLTSGEIYIATGSDRKGPWAHRPFWVQTPNADLEALGTQFTVDQNAQRTRLHVIESTVAIHNVQTVNVHAGESYDIHAANQAPIKTADTHFDPTGWMDGVLVAKGMRLDSFAIELSRYEAVNIQMDSEVAAMTVSGVFQLNQQHPAAHALQAVARSLPVTVSRLSATQFQIERK
jgi:ferric-dicitrate binding protein FerR (iron transport regulator)